MMTSVLSLPCTDNVMELKNLSEVELEIVIQVIQRDFEVKAADKVRLRRQRRLLKEADERVTILSNTEFNSSFCIICFRRFWPIFIPKHCCYSCHHYMCRKCSVYIKMHKIYICLLCQKERNLKSMACNWYYDVMRNRFEHDASELVAQSLFSEQGQFDLFMELADQLMSPDLLQKVKGAQISQYRQKIESKWQELEERLQRIEMNDVNPAKREAAYHQLREEFQTKFRNILKDFSQVLYVTLENYAAKVDDANINVNEQVINTVHEEVEQLIGYKVNCIPDDAVSFISDAESTASVFGNYHIEDKLATALIDKIFEDHRSVILDGYDIKFLDNINADDRSSTTTFVYRARPIKSGDNSTIVQSNITPSNYAPVNRLPPPSNQLTRSNTLTNNKTPIRRLSNGSNNSSVVTSSSVVVTDHYIEINETLASELNGTHELSCGSSEVLSSVMPPSKVGTNSNFKRQGSISSVTLSNVDLQQALRKRGSRSGVGSTTTSIGTSRTEDDRNSRHVCVPRGEQVCLQLELCNVQNIDVTWAKAEMGRTTVLRSNNAIEITKNTTKDSVCSNLRIFESKLSDSGLYTAMIENNPMARFTVKIIENENVPSKPQFRLQMMPVSCRSGNTCEFCVEVTGYPEPKVRFYHNNQIVNTQDDSQRKYQIEHNAPINRYILKISKITESDGGIYKCVASNIRGSSESSSKLTVTNVSFRFNKTVTAHDVIDAGRQSPNDKSYASSLGSSVEESLPVIPNRRNRKSSASSTEENLRNITVPAGETNHSLHQNVKEGRKSSVSGDSEVESQIFVPNTNTIPTTPPYVLPKPQLGTMIARERADEFSNADDNDLDSDGSSPFMPEEDDNLSSLMARNDSLISDSNLTGLIDPNLIRQNALRESLRSDTTADWSTSTPNTTIEVKQNPESIANVAERRKQWEQRLASTNTSTGSVSQSPQKQLSRSCSITKREPPPQFVENRNTAPLTKEIRVPQPKQDYY